MSVQKCTKMFKKIISLFAIDYMAWTYGLDGLRKGGKHPAYSLPKSVTLFSVGLGAYQYRRYWLDASLIEPLAFICCLLDGTRTRMLYSACAIITLPIPPTRVTEQSHLTETHHTKALSAASGADRRRTDPCVGA